MTTATQTGSQTAIVPHPLAADAQARTIDDFRRDGFAMLRGVLDGDDAARLRGLIDRVFADPRNAEEIGVYSGYIFVRLFEQDPVFRDLLVAEPFIGLAEALLGSQCHLVAQNIVRNGPGRAIDQWHVDDDLISPLPEGIPRHDPRVALPNLIVTFQILLTDVPTIDHGPTQFVPGSHYSGRAPEPGPEPRFEGRGPISMTGAAGDVYLQDPMCWHRGAPNRSDRTRYLLQFAYGRRFVAQRFHPFIDYRMPEHVWAGAGERLQRVLGRHPRGSYG